MKKKIYSGLFTERFFCILFFAVLIVLSIISIIGIFIDAKKIINLFGIVILMIAFAVPMILITVLSFRYIFVSEEGVEYTEKIYTDKGDSEEVVRICPWDTIHIILSISYGRGSHRIFRFNIKNDIRIDLNEERATEILSLYQKQVEISPDTLNMRRHYGLGKKIFEIVKEHNAKFEEAENFKLT